MELLSKVMNEVNPRIAALYEVNERMYLSDHTTEEDIVKVFHDPIGYRLMVEVLRFNATAKNVVFDVKRDPPVDQKIEWILRDKFMSARVVLAAQSDYVAVIMSEKEKHPGDCYTGFEPGRVDVSIWTLT